MNKTETINRTAGDTNIPREPLKYLPEKKFARDLTELMTREGRKNYWEKYLDIPT